MDAEKRGVVLMGRVKRKPMTIYIGCKHRNEEVEDVCPLLESEGRHRVCICCARCRNICEGKIKEEDMPIEKNEPPDTRGAPRRIIEEIFAEQGEGDWYRVVDEPGQPKTLQANLYRYGVEKGIDVHTKIFDGELFVKAYRKEIE